MHTKLTLRLDEQLIGQAKRYADNAGKSVSQLVAEYFALLEPPKGGGKTLTPRVQGLLGALKDADLKEADYRAYLEAKNR